MFVENGHQKTFPENLVKYYKAKKKTMTVVIATAQIKSRGYLILDQKTMTVAITRTQKRILWAPIRPKIRKEFKKVSRDITFTSDKKLQSTLYQNRPKLLPNSHLECTSWPVNTMVDIFANQKEKYWHIALNTSNWESSGATEHTKECHGQFNCIYSRTIAVMPNMYKRKVRESLEINRLKMLNETDKTFKVLNRDNGDCVTANSWKPLFRKIENH